MKRSLQLMLAILLGIYGVLSYINRNDDYAAEQNCWRLNKQLELLLRDPMAAPDGAFSEMESKYRMFADRYPMSYLAPQVYLTIGNMYVARKEYSNARSGIQEILQRFPQDQESCAQALAAIGRSYESENNWAMAQENYAILRKRFPLTTPGLENFLYIAQAYQKRGDTKNADIAFEQAIIHYKNIISQYPESSNEVRSLRLLAGVYVARGNWREAVETLGKTLILSGFLRTLTPSQANIMLKSINTISVVELKDLDLPLRIYSRFIEVNPGNSLRPVLIKLIKAIGSMRTKQK